ncbi:MAG TPA: hypothetical protein VE010_20270, partial [Thermoanaerobaculia bacterium]|nr:hypothetical protein [Thermoanaerobaculia bacterium]
MTVSYQWLIAEAVAWPLTSEQSFHAALSSFARKRMGVFADPTAGVAQSLEDHLRPLSRGLSLDSVRQLTVRAWFGEGAGEQTQTPAAFLARVAAEHLQHRGASVGLRVDGDAAATARKWRWMSLALPSDTLVAALSSAERKPPVSHVDLAPQLLAARLRDAPVAEGHLHVGAAVSFDVLWSSLSTVIGSPAFAGDELQAVGRPPFGSNRALTQRLLEAFIARLLIAAFLSSRRSSTMGGFGAWGVNALPSIGRSLDWSRGAVDAALLVAQVVQSLSRPEPSLSWPELRMLYRRLIRTPRGARPKEDDPFDRDPLRLLYPSGSPELAMQYEALNYIGCD